MALTTICASVCAAAHHEVSSYLVDAQALAQPDEFALHPIAGRAGAPAVSLMLLPRTEERGRRRLNDLIRQGRVKADPNRRWHVIDERTRTSVTHRRWIGLNVAPYSLREYLFNLFFPKAFARAHYWDESMPAGFMEASIRMSRAVMQAHLHHGAAAGRQTHIRLHYAQNLNAPTDDELMSLPLNDHDFGEAADDLMEWFLALNDGEQADVNTFMRLALYGQGVAFPFVDHGLVRTYGRLILNDGKAREHITEWARRISKSELPLCPIGLWDARPALAGLNQLLLNIFQAHREGATRVRLVDQLQTEVFAIYRDYTARVEGGARRRDFSIPVSGSEARSFLDSMRRIAGVDRLAGTPELVYHLDEARNPSRPVRMRIEELLKNLGTSVGGYRRRDGAAIQPPMIYWAFRNPKPNRLEGRAA